MDTEKREVCLVNPAPRGRRQYYDRLRVPILGIGYIASYIRAGGHGCAVVDAKMEGLPPEAAARKAAGARPFLVGVTAMTHEIGLAHEIASIVRSVSSGTLTAVGGAHASALPAQTLEEFPSFDFACFNEGEETLLELLAAAGGGGDTAGVCGISRRDGGEVRVNPPREWIGDLDRLPFPAWELFPSTRTYPIIGSRGCPYRCVFCMRALGERVRLRSPENVFEEYRWLVRERGAATIFFRDEVFGLKLAGAHRFLDLVVGEGLHKRARWSCQMRAGQADVELFRKMRRAGCFEVGFGVESGNPEILREIAKGITIEQVEEAVRLAKEASLRTAAFFILGHPNETRRTAADTVDFAARLNPTRISVGIMVPYPGTKVAEMAQKGEGGYRLLSRDWGDYDKYLGGALEVEGLPRAEMERLQTLAFIKLYLRNRRLPALAGLLFSRRREVFYMILRLAGFVFRRR
ncbi:MAG: radical SAM protein [bacterium]